MKKSIILMAFIAIAMMSCSSVEVDRMGENVNYCETCLDSIAKKTSFMDTVGETDEYMFLCDAYNEFTNATDKHERTRAYRAYKYWYDRVIRMHEDIQVHNMLCE